VLLVGLFKRKLSCTPSLTSALDWVRWSTQEPHWFNFSKDTVPILQEAWLAQVTSGYM
jgi:hypothetical protein